MTTLFEHPTATDWTARVTATAEEISPHAARHDRDGTFAAESLDTARRAGLTTMPIPVELGGGGASFAETNAALRALGAACGATAVTLSMHLHLVCTQLWRWRHGLPAEAVLRRVAEDDLLLVSTGASDWLGSSGTARRVDDGWIVSATKTPASGAPAGDVAVTSIRWEDGPDGPTVLHCSIPFAADGVSITRTWDTLGLRGTGSETVVFDDVFVPEDAVSLQRPADQWHPVWNAVLGTALPLICSAYLGIADAAVAETSARAGRSGEAPHVAPLVGTMLNAHRTAEDVTGAMVHDADELRFDNTDAMADRALTRKSIVSEAVETTARTAMRVVGGIGYHRDFAFERHLRDAIGCGHHPLPLAKQVRFTGRRHLGLDPLA